jgi:formylglycine-generating enzyme required for sulfatase activity
MSNSRNEPKECDAVLGGKNSPPIDGAVLGGIAGVKSRLTSPIVEVRIAALSAASQYGAAGLDLIIQALHDRSMQVKLAAHLLLKDRDELKLKPNFPQDYLPTFEFDVIAVGECGQENSRIKSFARFFPEDLGNGITLDMVYIPGGTFMMGSPLAELGRSDREGPQHQVTVPAFYAGKYPITQAQWETVMGNNPSDFKGEQYPVQNVSWDDAVEFCHQLSEKTGKSYRLLSEAEWEYACRAGTTTPFCFGETITADLVNYHGRSSYADAPQGLYRGQVVNAGSFPPNGFGLYDMHGQVWEWCSDRRHYNYNGAPTDGSSWETGTGNHRMQRGGAWNNGAVYCRSACRNYFSAGHSYRLVGFRVAAVVRLASSLAL